MKTKSAKIFYSLLLLAFLPAVFFATMFFSKPSSSKAEQVSTEYTIEDVVDKRGNFTLKSTAVARSGGSPQNTIKTITVDGREINYYCYNWRDINSITFNFTSSITDSKNIFTNYEFLVTTIQTENLQTSIGQAEPKTLISGTISSNNISIPNVYYYFDSDYDTSLSEHRFNGNDFGIYKFDFNYTYLEDSSPDSSAHKISIGELYIAVLPDNVDNISTKGLSLNYTVSSSNGLMNVYNISFSNKDVFKYVNPKYIKWNVIGKDKKGAEYVLTKQIRDEKYISHKYIWEALPTKMQEGPTFLLDTNNIEGDWTASCTIYNSNGTVKANFSTGKLTTVKHKEKSNIWLILVIILAALVLVALITLLIYKLKNRKKS